MELKFRAWDKRFKKFDYGQGSLLLRHNSDDYEKVQQYIGLKDKNGKEIYEGDIIKIYDCVDTLYKVEYFDNVFAYGVTNINPKDGEWGDGMLEELATKLIEVVGNIYENKEMLK